MASLPSSVLEQTTLVQVVQLVNHGVERTVAAASVGLTTRSFQKLWMAGEKASVARAEGIVLTGNDHCLADMYDDIVQAEAMAEAVMTGVWFETAKDGNWNAAERFLAARYPSRWGAKAASSVDHTHRVTVSLKELSSDKEALEAAGVLAERLLGSG